MSFFWLVNSCCPSGRRGSALEDARCSGGPGRVQKETLGNRDYEAATVDGANRWQTFTRIVLPLSMAPLVTLAVLSCLTNWNDFLWPGYVTFTPESLTLPLGLAILQSACTTNYAVIMAGGVIASIRS